ncbi:MAG: hypothetical protein HS117_00440 [Verrucomicrobiaceae bacterium]|nr:hypothetical protein [Verrucomicrobiaceae bacterium]
MKSSTSKISASFGPMSQVLEVDELHHRIGLTVFSIVVRREGLQGVFRTFHSSQLSAVSLANDLAAQVVKPVEDVSPAS